MIHSIKMTHLNLNFKFMDNQIKSNQIKSNQIKSNQIKSNQIKSNQIKSNQIKSNQIKSNQIKSNQIKSNQIKSNQIKSNPKILLLASLCAVALLWGCKGDDEPILKVEADFTLTFGSKGAVTFKNTSKNATSYAWDFGDGSKATEENPTHTYTKDGTYTIKLTATNAGGSAEKTATVTISLEGTSTQLIANFTFAVDEKTAGKVTFTNTSEGATSYAWDFGDGNKATDENPTHTYAKDDTYTVKLTATNAGGGTDNITKEVKITNSGITSIDIADLSQLVLPKNSPNGVVIGKLAATVANTDETPVFSITSQNPAGAVGLDGNKMMLTDASAVDYDTNTELTGEIQATVGSATATAAFTISITEGAGIYIPDANFKSLLVGNTALNTDGDQEISVAEAQVYAGAIEANNQGITDATGIEYFTKVTDLALLNNALTAVNVSNNTALSLLDLSQNQLRSLNVSQNTKLTVLNVPRNNLKEIDVSQNTALINLNLSINQFQTIDISRNTALNDLFLIGNQLTAIDVSKNTALTQLDLSKNKLTALDVSQNIELKNIRLVSNQLTELDVSQNTKLFLLHLYQNALIKEVILANGNNDNLTDLDMTENPNLTCVQVDDPSAIPSAWEGKYDKDKVTFQTTECSN